MKKILAFGASNSRNSINKQLAQWASQQLPNAAVTLIDLNDFDMPIFGVDREREEGFPDAALRLKELVKTHDGILISLAEHNGAYSAVFKNAFDWISRMEGKTWDDKPMFLLATSGGGRGGASVLDIASRRFPFNGGKVVATFALPFFNENFSAENGIEKEELKAAFLAQAELFVQALEMVGA